MGVPDLLRGLGVTAATLHAATVQSGLNRPRKSRARVGAGAGDLGTVPAGSGVTFQTTQVGPGAASTASSSRAQSLAESK
jgi:hypothetical protein